MQVYKVFVTITIIVLTFTTLLNGCSKPAMLVREDTIKIGWIGPLTGDQETWGQCELNTIKMIFERINKDHGGVLGKKLQVIGYDTKGDPNETMNSVKILIEQDKVMAILGPNSSSCAIPISGLLEAAKVAGIATVATNPRVTVENGVVKPYSFRVSYIDTYQGEVAAAYSRDVLSAQTAAILFDSTDRYSFDLALYFEEQFVQKGGELVAKESFKTGDSDFREQLLKIKDIEPQVLFMPLYHHEVGIAAKQARDMGIKSIFIGGDGWPSDILYRDYKEYIEGSIIVNHLNTSDPEVQELREEYFKKYNMTIELNGYMAHDAVLVLVEAIKAAKELNSQKIAQAIVEVDVKGVTGRIKFGRDTHNPEGKEAAIIKLVDGKEVFVQKFSKR